MITSSAKKWAWLKSGSSFSWLQLKPIPAEMEIIKGMSLSSRQSRHVKFREYLSNCAKSVVDKMALDVLISFIAQTLLASNFSLFVSAQVLPRLEREAKEKKNYL